MFVETSFLAYLAACVALLVVPGPSVLYIVTRSIEGGRTAGLVSALGIATGTVGHVLASAVGVSALLAGSPVLFAIVRYAGAGYLAFLGIRRLVTREAPRTAEPEAGRGHSGSLGRTYGQAILVNLLNPKTTLFFLAFLPQFVSPKGGSVVLQIVILGGILIGLGVLSDGAYALVAGTAREALTGRRHFGAITRYGSGVVYLGLGVFAAVSGS